jgi:hypothetical protein
VAGPPAGVNTLLDEALDVAARVFGQGVVCAVIGGCARNAYAPARATKDVDLAVDLDGPGFAAVRDALQDVGFHLVSEVRAEETSEVPDVALFRNANGARIDLLIAKTDFEREALSRRSAPATAGALSIVTVEDLLVYKLIAGRTRDMADAEEVVSTQVLGGRVIDWDYVARWCVEWGFDERLAALRRATE